MSFGCNLKASVLPEKINVDLHWSRGQRNQPTQAKRSANWTQTTLTLILRQSMAMKQENMSQAAKKKRTMMISRNYQMLRMMKMTRWN